MIQPNQIGVPALRVQLVERVAAVPERDWDAVAGDHLLYTHRWQRLMEAHLRDYDPFYVLVYAGADLVGFAIGGSLPSRLARKGPALLQPLASRALRQSATFCAPPLGLDLQGVVVQPGRLDAEAIVGAALDGIARHAPRARQMMQMFSAESSDTLLTRVLARRGAHSIPAESYAVLDLRQCRSFEEYVERISRRPRRVIRKEIERARQAGVTIRPYRPSELPCPDATVYALMRNVVARYSSQPAFDQQVLAGVRRELNEQTTLLVVAIGERIIGVCLGFHDRQMIKYPYHGLDYSVAQQHNTYFLIHYEMIRYALELGVPYIHAGIGHMELKRRFGYQFMPRRYLIHSSSHLLQSAIGQLQRRINLRNMLRSRVDVGLDG